MRILLLAACLALAGCAESADPPTQQTSQEPWEETLDILPMLETDTIVLVGYRATQETEVRHRDHADFSVSTEGRASHSLSWTGMGADVEGLQRAAAEGTEMPDAWHGSGGGGGGGVGGAGVVGDIRLDNMAVYEAGGGSSHSGGSGTGGGTLAKGDWLLIVAGLCGNDEVDGEWTWQIEASAPLEKVVLPSAVMVCGVGFDSFPQTNVGPLHLDAVEATWPATYGASLQVMSFGGFQQPDGDWILPDERVPIRQGMTMEGSRLPGEMGFEVRDHAGSRALWVFSGLAAI